jgi:hypothetical protein
LDIELPMQSVPITTNVASSNSAHGAMYLIQQFVSDLQQVRGFLRFPPPIKRFQTRHPQVQKWMYLLFVHRELIFHLILMGF